MVKRFLAICLICIFMICVMPYTSVFSDVNYIISPATEISGESMKVKLSLPSGTLGGEFLIDGESYYTLPKSDKGGECAFELSLEDISYGIHFIFARIKTATGIVEEEKKINIKGNNIPYIENAAYISGGENIWTDNLKSTKEGYTVKFSDDFSSLSAKLYYINTRGRKVEIPSSFKKNGREVTVFPLRVPSVYEKNLIEFYDLEYNGTKTKNVQFYFDVQKISEDKILYVTRYDQGETPSQLKQSGGTVFWDKEEGNGVLHLKSTSGEQCKSYADVVIGNIGGCTSYVIDFKLKIKDLTGEAYLTLFDGKDTDGEWKKGIKISSSLVPYKGTVNITDTPVEKNKWTRVCAVYNTDVETAIYIDGKKVYTYGASRIKPSTFRVDFIAESTENIDVLIDDYLIYEGTAPKDIIEKQENNYSVMDAEEKARAEIGDGAVFSCISDYYYYGGVRKAYKNAAEKPVIHDGKAYVPTEFLSSVYGCISDKNAEKVSVSGKIFSKGDKNTFSENGDLYILADDIFSALGKKYLYDDRGYFIISDNEITAVNGPKIEKLFEEADYIHRFITFDNSRGEEMLESFSLYGEHPRVLFTQDALNYINSHLDDPEIVAARERSIKRAGNSLGYTGLTPNPADNEKKSQATSWQSAMNNLAEAYLLTGDTTYADEGIRLMDIAVQWDNLALYRTRLTIGHYAMSMAIGYDSFYNYLNETDSGRAKLKVYRDAMRKLVFKDTIYAYRGLAGSKWITIDDNFSGVCGGGVMALALSMADEEELADIMPYLLENLIKTNQLSAVLYHSDGGYYEGIGYSNYMLKNLAISTEALFGCMGSDFGLSNATGFKNAGEFFVYMQSVGNSFNFSDSGQGVTTASLPYWFAYRYGKTDAAHIHYHMNKYRSYVNNIRDMYFYKRAVENSEYNIENAALDKFYPVIETGSFRNTFLSGAQTFAGFRAGRNGMAHDHLDIGEFVFESDNVMWAHDLGNDSYDLPAYFSNPEGYRIYRKKTEGENCLVINPAVDADTYYGQNTKADTSLKKMETKPKGAYAIFDLTDAYKRDAESYTRGYYFGDNRSTLIVQDELKLKKSDSEIYWFMHTPASIEVLSDTEAMLTAGAQKLYVKIYTNVSGAEILDMKPAPLPTSPQIEGQAENSGRKLAVHIPAASGNVQIAVKLVPMSAEGATELKFTPMDNWSIEDGEIEKETFSILRPTQGSFFRERNIPVEIYSEDGVPRAYVDGSEITLKSDGNSIYKGEIKYTGVNLGKHTVKAVCGDKVKEVKTETFATISTEKEYTLQNLGSISNGKAEACEGADKSADGGIKITRGEKNSYYRLNLSESGKTVFIDFDVKTPEEGGKFDLECYNGTNYTWFGAKELIMPGGQIAGTNIFMPTNEWHNIRIVQELENNGQCEVYYDGKLIKKELSEYDMSKLSSMKIQVLSGSICLDNIRFGEYKENPRCISAVYGDANGEENADGDKIALNSQYVTMRFSPAFDSVGRSDVSVNGKTPQSVTVQGEYVKVALGEPIKEKEIKITFSSSLKSGGLKINKATDVRFAVDFKSDKIDVGDIIINGDTAKISASFERGDISDFSEKGYFVIASYKGDEMVNISLKTVNFNGKSEVCLEALCGGDTIKAYLWTNEHKSYLVKEAKVLK